MAIGENIDAQKLLQRFERLPPPARSGVLGAVGFVVVALYMVLFFGGNQSALHGLQNKRAKLEQDIQSARAVANNLDSFKKKREELGEQLQAALEKLPESSDLPALLTNISTLGKKSGLEIQTFKQGKKIRPLRDAFTWIIADLKYRFERPRPRLD